jgi:hypothetical protein
MATMMSTAMRATATAVSQAVIEALGNKPYTDNALLTLLNSKKKTDIGDNIICPIYKGDPMNGGETDPVKIKATYAALAKESGDNKVPVMNEELTNAKYDFAQYGACIGMTKREIMAFERAPGELKNTTAKKMMRFVEMFKQGTAYNMMASDGTTSNAFYGIDQLMDNTVSLGGVSPTTYPMWKAKNCDLAAVTVASSATFGYISTDIDTRSEAISATSSKTANLPKLIDIVLWHRTSYPHFY